MTPAAATAPRVAPTAVPMAPPTPMPSVAIVPASCFSRSSWLPNQLARVLSDISTLISLSR